MAKKVYIGIGHGGSDNGASANGFKEDNLALAIGKYCQERLKQYSDVETKISRTTDKDVSIDTKVAESDKFKADVCMDIHINAGGGNGCEVYYSGYRADKAKSKAIAQSVEAAIKAIGQNSRGLKTKSNSAGNADYFGMVRRPDAPSVLIECAFIDNKADLAIIDTAAEQKKFGYAIADGVAKYLGVKLKSSASTSTSKSSGGFEMKTYKNGSTKEYVYQTIADCKAQKSAKAIGYLDPRESCGCYGKIDGVYLVVYTAGSTKKTGFVKYSGGVK